MAHRTFTDDAGGVWDVWDVVPLGLAALDADTDGAASAAPPTVGGQRRGHVAPALRNGWLAFRRHGEDEARRLSPIPADWERAAASQLARYCRDAAPARPPRPPHP